MMQISRTLCFLASFFCLVALPPQVPVEAADSPNFIVILSDDQSWVGSSVCMAPGDKRTRSDYFQTPQLERLANLGMRFTQGYSPAASCCPTRRAIQTGQAPARHEYNSDRKGWPSTYAKQLNIPRLLKTANPDYKTAHFGKWDHRYDEITPAQQGYDHSDGYTGNGEGGSKGSGGPSATPDPKLVDSITDQALRFIHRNHATRTPFYLQISHYAVHLDIYYNKSTFEKTSKWAAGKKHTMPEFAAMTWDLDAAVGRVIDKLEQLEMLDNTWIIFLSDNGGRTSMPRAPTASKPRNAPLRDGKHSFYEGGVRVPFIIVGPGVPPNSASSVPVTGLDILPTLAELANYSDALPENIDGGSLCPLLLTNADQVKRPRPYLVFHQAADRTPISAIRWGDYKLVKTWRKTKVELFDLSSDLSEANDLAQQQPEKANELEGVLLQYLKEVGAELRSTRKK